MMGGNRKGQPDRCEGIDAIATARRRHGVPNPLPSTLPMGAPGTMATLGGLRRRGRSAKKASCSSGPQHTVCTRWVRRWADTYNGIRAGTLTWHCANEPQRVSVQMRCVDGRERGSRLCDDLSHRKVNCNFNWAGKRFLDYNVNFRLWAGGCGAAGTDATSRKLTSTSAIVGHQRVMGRAGSG